MQRIKRFASTVRPPKDWLLWLLACSCAGMMAGAVYVIITRWGYLWT